MIGLAQQHVIAPKIGQMLQDALGVRLGEQAAIDDAVVEDEAAVADEVDIDDLDIGVGEAYVVLARELPADAAIAALVVDGTNLDAGALLGDVVQMEQPEVPD